MNTEYFKKLSYICSGTLNGKILFHFKFSKEKLNHVNVFFTEVFAFVASAVLLQFFSEVVETEKIALYHYMRFYDAQLCFIV